MQKGRRQKDIKGKSRQQRQEVVYLWCSNCSSLRIRGNGKQSGGDSNFFNDGADIAANLDKEYDTSAGQFTKER